MHDYFSGGGMGLGGFGMVLWWILPIAAIVLLVKWLSQSDGWRRDKSALDILRERYARGEIDQEEYQRKLRELGG